MLEHGGNIERLRCNRTPYSMTIGIFSREKQQPAGPYFRREMKNI